MLSDSNVPSSEASMLAGVLHVVQGPNRRQFGDAMMAGGEIKVLAVTSSPSEWTLDIRPWELVPTTMKRVDDVFELIGTCQSDTKARHKIRGFLVWIEETPHGVLELIQL